MTLANKINVWLTDTSKELDISYLGLKEWPELLKGKEHLIVNLDCYNNQLKSLPDFPNLTYVNLKNKTFAVKINTV